MILLEHSNIGKPEEYKLYLNNEGLYEVHLIHHERAYDIGIWKDIKSHKRKFIKYLSYNL